VKALTAFPSVLGNMDKNNFVDFSAR